MDAEKLKEAIARRKEYVKKAFNIETIKSDYFEQIVEILINGPTEISQIYIYIEARRQLIEEHERRISISS